MAWDSEDSKFTSSSNKATHTHPSQIVLQTGDQASKYMKLWGFSHTNSEIFSGLVETSVQGNKSMIKKNKRTHLQKL